MRHVMLIAAGVVVVCACSDPPPAPNGIVDSGKDVRIVGDERTDTGTDGGICAPADVSAFTPSWVPPKPASSACTPANVDQYAKDCLDPQTSTNTACTAFTNANKACAACLVTPDSATAYGAAIALSNGVLSLNVGGCIALLSADVSATGCGARYEANRQCADASCTDNCPIPQGDDPAFQKYVKCLSDASKTTCKSYSSAVCPEPDAGALTACALNGASFVDNFKAIAPIFCASGG